MSQPSDARLVLQVGGHPGVQSSEGLFFKPAHPREIAFYRALESAVEREAEQEDGAVSSLALLHNYVPTFIGTLDLVGQVPEDPSGRKTGDGNENVDLSKVVPVHDAHESDKQALVLEDMRHGFTKPSVIDIKLGTVLYGQDATQQKREKMKKAAKIYTSGTDGVRIVGFSVYDNDHADPVVVPKQYGKSLKSANLPEAIASFFPVAKSDISSGGSANGLGPSKSSDLNEQARSPTFVPSDYPGPLTTPSGHRPSTLLSLLDQLLSDLDDIRIVMEDDQLDLCIVGGSLLIVYESDWKRAEEAISHENSRQEGKSDDMQEYDEDDNDDNENGEDDDEDDDEDEDELAPSIRVCLIDFAHSSFASPDLPYHLKDGQDPDKKVLREGQLKGLKTVISLVKGRRREIKAMVGRS